MKRRRTTAHAARPATHAHAAGAAKSQPIAAKPRKDAGGTGQTPAAHEQTKKLRAVGYCRTSGEGQRDNTSIPNQQQSIEEFARRNGWKFLRHYVDECKSGAKEEGRDDFKRMIRDAASEHFDVIVPFDVSRFARDGVDILGNAKLLRQTFGVHVVDTKEQFDSRSSRNTLLNFVHAGVSEHERLSIMERMIRGRIKRAEAGRPWSGNRPFGRDYNPATGKWSVNERGLRMRKLLERYAAGEGLAELLQEFTEFSSSRVVLTFVRSAQLSGVYVKEFHIPEIGVEHQRIAIPVIPEVISATLMKRVQGRMEHRRTWNKDNRRKYLLTGFVRCGHCGTALTGNATSGRLYYRHCDYSKAKRCVYHSVRGELLVDPTLDYLFWLFTDEPAFNKAVARALPDVSERRALEQERTGALNRRAKVQKEIDALVNALKQGAAPTLLIGEQARLITQRDREAEKLESLTAQIESMPSPEIIQQQAHQIRKQLLQQVEDRDWRTLPFDEIKQFMVFLFGENPAKSGTGIKLTF